MAGAVRELVTLLKFRVDKNSLQGAKKQEENLKKGLEGIDRKKAKLNVNSSELARAGEKLNTFSRSISAIAKKRITISANATPALTAVSRLSAELKGIHDKKITVNASAKKTEAGGGLGGTVGNVAGAAAAGAAAGAAAIGGGAYAIAQTSDEMAALDGRLRSVTKSEEECYSLERKLYEQAQKSRVAYADLGNMYYGIAQAMKDYGTSEADILKVTDTVSKSLIAGGASKEQTEGVILQLTQALQSGVLQGDELHSLREGAPDLVRDMAAAMGAMSLS